MRQRLSSSSPSRDRDRAASPRTWVHVMAWCTAVWLLSACGGGGGSGADNNGAGQSNSAGSGLGATPVEQLRPIVANSYGLSLAAGQSTTLWSNHSLGGVAASGANMSLTVTSNPLPAGLAVNGAELAVSTDAPTGPSRLDYRICELANVSNCANVTLSLNITPAALVANADSFSLQAGAAATGDVLANDSLAGAAVLASQLIVNAAAVLPTGMGLSNRGVLSVDASTAAGRYDIGYRICQSTLPSNCADGAAVVTVVAASAPSGGTSSGTNSGTSNISGRAINAYTGLGVAGVKVSVAEGGLSTVSTVTTDSTGAFSLTDVANAARVSLLFNSSTHALGARTAGGAVGGVQARLVPLSSAIELPASGGTATQAGSLARVVLPAAAVQNANGNAPSGNLRVQLTPFDAAPDSSVVPGDYTSLIAGVPTPIEIFGAVELRISDKSDNSGTPLALRAGQTASLRIPVATRADALPTTLPLFVFDSPSGRWLQSGTADLAGTAPNFYYEGQVSRTGVWAAGQALDTVRVSGCVVDAAGAAVAGAQVFGDGADYSNTITTTSDSNGKFSLPVRLNGQATLTALAGQVWSTTERVGPFTLNTPLPGCLHLGAAGTTATMKLTWGDAVEDLDAHLFAPDGSHIYFDSRGASTSAPFATLDLDDTNGYGPEVNTLTRWMVGTYQYAVNNYEGQAKALMSSATPRVELNLPGRAPELFVLPSSGQTSSSDWWLVFELDVDAGCNVTVRRVGSFSNNAPSAAAGGAAVYCSR